MLSLDPNLAKVHSRLISRMPEKTFWHHYFSRVADLRAEVGLEPLCEDLRQVSYYLVQFHRFHRTASMRQITLPGCSLSSPCTCPSRAEREHRVGYPCVCVCVCGTFRAMHKRKLTILWVSVDSMGLCGNTQQLNCVDRAAAMRVRPSLLVYSMRRYAVPSPNILNRGFLAHGPPLVTGCVWNVDERRIRQSQLCRSAEYELTF